jgi:hypothetical protein
MVSKTTSNNPDEIKTSVSSLYAQLLEKRREVNEAKEEEKRQKKEAELENKIAKDEENEFKMTKKQKRQAEMDNWKEIIIGLTGDDLDYVEDKKTKKKYRKWIDDDVDANAALAPKPKKVKKRNYHKEFEPELNMLKNIVADQNKFTVDLQKRFQNAAGPATKDGMPLNKTLVDLAAAVNASRANSLGMLREIGGIKKTVAELYMKQKKLDSDLGTISSAIGTGDVGLMGSSIASSLFADEPIAKYDSEPIQQTSSISTPVSATVSNVIIPGQEIAPTTPTYQAQSFDPSTWKGPDLGVNDSTRFENIPHKIVVEYHPNEHAARFKAIREDNGEELVGCPVPTSDTSKLVFNEKDLTVKGQFDEIYPLEIIS